MYKVTKLGPVSYLLKKCRKGYQISRVLNKKTIISLGGHHPNDLPPVFMKHIFTEFKNPYNLRNKSYFYADSIHTVLYGSKSISFRGPKTWDLVPDEIKNSNGLLDFKHKIMRWRPQGCSCRLCRVYIARFGFL